MFPEELSPSEQRKHKPVMWSQELCEVGEAFSELGTEATVAGMGKLTRARVEEFYLSCAKGRGHSLRRQMGQALRTFLHFCHEQGTTRVLLAGAMRRFSPTNTRNRRRG